MPLQDNELPVPMSAADFSIAETARDTLLQKVTPLLRHFAPEAIKRMTRYGPKSDAFVQEAEAAVEAVGNDLPAVFNATQFHDAILVMVQITELLGPLSAIVDGLNDAEQMVGSFLMQNANWIYAQLKQVQNLDPRVVPYVEEMGRRYEGQGKRTDLNPTT